MSRTRKRAYTRSKRFDRSCRNHGACKWCEGNRTHFDTKARAAAEHQLDQVWLASEPDAYPHETHGYVDPMYFEDMTI